MTSETTPEQQEDHLRPEDGIISDEAWTLVRPLEHQQMLDALIRQSRVESPTSAKYAPQMKHAPERRVVVTDDGRMYWAFDEQGQEHLFILESSFVLPDKAMLEKTWTSQYDTEPETNDQEDSA